MIEISVDISESKHRLAQLVRDACLSTAITHFEDARVDGLCCEGAWEAAIEAIRAMNVEGLINQLEDHRE